MDKYMKATNMYNNIILSIANKNISSKDIRKRHNSIKADTYAKSNRK